MPPSNTAGPSASDLEQDDISRQEDGYGNHRNAAPLRGDQHAFRVHVPRKRSGHEQRGCGGCQQQREPQAGAFRMHVKSLIHSASSQEHNRTDKPRVPMLEPSRGIRLVGELEDGRSDNG